jgi:hypothetical protein
MGDKIIIDKDDLVRIADTVRLKKGSTELLSLYDIFASLEDNLYLIVDEDGNQLFATFTEQEILTNATANDIRIGKTAVTENGLVEGENTITYRTTEGWEYVLPDSDFVITGLHEYNKYNYTKIQCVIAKYVSSTDKTAIEKIVLNDNVYNAGSSTVISTLTKDINSKTVNLNITNNTSDIYIIYFFTYAEEEA